MADDARAAALVKSIIDLGHSMGLRVVAESVETLVALTQLTRYGCDWAQGSYLSRPVRAAELGPLARPARQRPRRPGSTPR